MWTMLQQRCLDASMIGIEKGLKLWVRAVRGLNKPLRVVGDSTVYTYSG